MCSDEVMELMAGEFPRKYDEYMDVVQEREFQAALKRKILETKRVAQMHVGGCMCDLMRTIGDLDSLSLMM